MLVLIAWGLWGNMTCACVRACVWHLSVLRACILLARSHVLNNFPLLRELQTHQIFRNLHVNLLNRLSEPTKLDFSYSQLFHTCELVQLHASMAKLYTQLTAYSCSWQYNSNDKASTILGFSFRRGNKGTLTVLCLAAHGLLLSSCILAYTSASYALLVSPE